MNNLVTILYIIAFSMFIYGLMGLTGPKTAVRGNYIAGWGMVLAVVATLIDIDAAEIRAKPTQKTMRSAGVASPAEIASARMSATVRARPIAPAKSGVKPANRR